MTDVRTFTEDHEVAVDYAFTAGEVLTLAALCAIVGAIAGVVASWLVGRGR